MTAYISGPNSTTISNISVTAELLEDHAHKEGKVHPTLAAGVDVTAGASWVLGSFATLVAASTITSDFDIHHVLLEALDDNTTYELVLYAGAGDVEIGRVRFVKDTNNLGLLNIPIQTPIVAANDRIRAKLASANGTSVAKVSLFYHTY